MSQPLKETLVALVKEHRYSKVIYQLHLLLAQEVIPIHVGIEMIRANSREISCMAGWVDEHKKWNEDLQKRNRTSGSS